MRLWTGDQDTTKTNFLSAAVLTELMQAGIRFWFLVLKVGDLYGIPKGVGHFFYTLPGTTHSVIGMQTVLKRPRIGVSGGPPAHGSVPVSTAEYKKMQADFLPAEVDDEIANLFEVKSASSVGRKSLFLKETSASVVRLPVTGRIILSHELGELGENCGRVFLTPWCLNQASDVVFLYNPPPPP